MVLDPHTLCCSLWFFAPSILLTQRNGTLSHLFFRRDRHLLKKINKRGLRCSSWLKNPLSIHRALDSTPSAGKTSKLNFLVVGNICPTYFIYITSKNAMTDLVFRLSPLANSLPNALPFCKVQLLFNGLYLNNWRVTTAGFSKGLKPLNWSRNESLHHEIIRNTAWHPGS